MRVRRLRLEDFRSYAQVEVALEDGNTVFVGPNGAGKTNLLEALVLLAHGSSSRATDDADLVRWGATLARVRADVARAEDERRLEAVIFGHAEGERRRPKRFLIDGAAKRSADLAGELRVVAFFPEEVTLLCEAPSARRRYLDAMIGQVDRRYRRETLELQRVLEQRNALLRAARDETRPVADDEIAFWDDELVRIGAAVAARRMHVVAELAPLFARAHERLASRGETTIAYQCQVARGDVAAIEAAYRELIRAKREHEAWQGATLVGPHRDDLVIATSGRPLPTYASRGEHRTAILALKLAESAWIVEQTSEEPVFLLDDVLSELDPERRERLTAAIPRPAQCLITAAAPSGLPDALVRTASRREVSPGTVADAPAR
ncbi:MAG TPA: DNA replication/repair protein RecF [Candidatus Dormibacteraeota bacterium]|jgi:DNA replication and repair protein RecF|nr:DNA replication/repair protein RecF [Candidatus Dormibacteraeota bacterium]